MDSISYLCRRANVGGALLGAAVGAWEAKLAAYTVRLPCCRARESRTRATRARRQRQDSGASRLGWPWSRTMPGTALWNGKRIDRAGRRDADTARVPGEHRRNI